jgi:uroporphyrinogen decarboxylase
MTGKQRIINTIKLQETDRTSWVPFVGCHGGALLGKSSEEYLKSEKLIIEGTVAAIQKYNPDGIPVTFDLQIEAEALGCKLQWGEETPPAVITHPLANGTKLDDLRIPELTTGRIPMVLNASKQIRKKFPDIALYGLVTGPFTLALHLLGTDLFMRMFDDEAYIHDLMVFCSEVADKMAKGYIDAGCDIIAVVDPMTSQIGPDQFRQFVTPYATEIFKKIKSQKAYSSFFVCGQAQQNIEAMVDCKPDNISIDENIPLDYVRDICHNNGISFGGNLKLTVVLLMGSEEDCQRDALECMDIGGQRGFILAPGCDLPYATPPQNLQAVTKLVHDPYQQDVIRTLSDTKKTDITLDMSDYGKMDKVIVDVITLDSESCAPCQYSVEAVQKAVDEFEGIVEWREHKIKYKESVLFMTSIMVKSIPTICIDGVITFVSKIPPKQELVAAIQKRIYEKLRHKIKIKKGSVLLLGREDSELENLRPIAEQAVRELGADVSIEEVTDEKRILELGVSRTPAILILDYKLKAEGAIPSVAVVKEWIKEIL